MVKIALAYSCVAAVFLLGGAQTYNSLALTTITSQANIPTFYRNVLPIIQKRCQSCHRPGEIAPMPFGTYQQTRPWAGAIRSAVLQKKMPPWFADSRYIQPSGTIIETLLRVNYDFYWQLSYRLAEPRFLKAGTELQAVAWFDNSSQNSHNPNPNVSVSWGDQTYDEMMVGFFDVAVPAGLDKQHYFIRRSTD